MSILNLRRSFKTIVKHAVRNIAKGNQEEIRKSSFDVREAEKIEHMLNNMDDHDYNKFMNVPKRFNSVARRSNDPRQVSLLDAIQDIKDGTNPKQ